MNHWLQRRAATVLALVAVALAAMAHPAQAGDPYRYADSKQWPDWAVSYMANDSQKAFPNDGELVDAIRYELIRGYPIVAQDRLQYRDREFRFDREMTRAEFAAVLSRSLALATDGSGDQWFAPHVAALRERGVVLPDASEEWAAPVSRREAGQWMGRAAEAFKADDAADTRTFPDVDDPLIQRALRAGIVKGTDQGRYEPDRTLIRIEAAVMLLRLARAMNSLGNAQNPQVLAALQDVIKEADQQASERLKRWVQLGHLDGVETGGVRTQEFADALLEAARSNLAATGGPPYAWPVLAEADYHFKPLEVHDTVAALQSCGSAQVFRASDPPDKPWFEEHYCERQFLVFRDGRWLLAGSGRE